MERKIKHRILGILVVMGLVIILLPLFQTGLESTESSTVQAPPFPDQSVQTPTPPEQAQHLAPQDQDMSVPQPIPLQNPAQDSGINQQPDDTVNSNSPSQSVPVLPNQENATPAPISNSQPSINNNSEAPSALPNTSSNEVAPQANNAPNENQPNVSLDMPKQISELTKVTDNTAQSDQFIESAAPSENIAKPEIKSEKVSAENHIAKKRSQKLVSKKRAIPLNQPLDDDGLFKLKNSVWVIQLGSFKNKANALRLVNKLRSSGYAAFIQQMASSTRVFVGPETKQHSARTLASQINSEMHIQGIVISYKPLAI